jgi:hypothetical protein
VVNCRQEAIVKFACRVDVHRIDVVRFPLLHHLRRLRIDIQFLAFEHPLGVLSNLPSIQEVSVAVKCVNWRESIAIDFWVESIDEVVWNNTADLVKVEELTHSEWRYELVLEATFWEGFGLGDWKVGCGTHGRFGLRCKVCVSKGRILELDAEEGVKEEWRRALEGELGLEKGMKGKNSDGDGDQDEEEDEDDDDNDDDNDGDEDEGEDEEDAEAQEEHTSQEPPEHQIAKRSQHQEACTREDDDDAQRAVDNLKEVVDGIQEDGTEARDYLINRPASCFIQGFVNACSQRA